MNSIVIAIIAYVGWTIIKNFIRESVAPGSSAGEHKMPPVVHRTGMPYGQGSRSFGGSDVKRNTAQSTPTYATTDSSNKRYTHPSSMYEREDITTTRREDAFIRPKAEEIVVDGGYKSADSFEFKLNNQSILSGIIMSEILQPPKSKRHK